MARSRSRRKTATEVAGGTSSGVDRGSGDETGPREVGTTDEE